MELLQELGATILFLLVALVVVSAILGDYGWGIKKVKGGYELRFGCGLISITREEV